MRPTESFERKNVTELGLDALDTTAGFRFDPTEELTDRDWELMYDHGVTVQSNNNQVGSDGAEHLENMLILDPQRSIVWPSTRNSLHAMRKSVLQGRDGWNLGWVLKAIRRLDPIHFTVTEWDRTLLQRELVTQRNNSGVQLAIFFDRLAAIDRQLAIPTKGDLAMMHRALVDARGLNDVYSLAVINSTLATIDQTRYTINPEDWNMIKQEFQKAVTPTDLAFYAARLTEISRAEQKPAGTEDVPPVPETKSF